LPSFNKCKYYIFMHGDYVTFYFKENIKFAIETIGVSLETFHDVLQDQYDIEKIDYENLDYKTLTAVESCLALKHSVTHPYFKEYHLNLICEAILKKNFIFKNSVNVENYFNEFKKRRWNDEANSYGFRLRWQIRINRFFNENKFIPNIAVRIPYVEDLVNQNILFALSFLKSLYRRRKYLKANGTLHGHYSFDRRYGGKVLFKDDQIFYGKENTFDDKANISYGSKNNDLFSEFIGHNLNYTKPVAIGNSGVAPNENVNIDAAFWKQQRLDAGLTHEQVAKELGYSSSLPICRWEKGESFPPKEDLSPLLNLYKIDVSAYIELALMDQRKQMNELLTIKKNEN